MTFESMDMYVFYLSDVQTLTR